MPKAFDQFVTFLYANDLEESSTFYGEKLRLEMLLGQGPCRIFRAGGDCFLSICTNLEAPAERGNVIATLVTDDVDGWCEDLKAPGVTFEKTPQANPCFNIYHLLLRDQAGYPVEIQQFLDPAWPKPRGT